MRKTVHVVTEDTIAKCDGKDYLLEKGDEVIIITEGLMKLIKKALFEILRKFLPISPEKAERIKFGDKEFNMKDDKDVLDLFRSVRSK